MQTYIENQPKGWEALFKSGKDDLEHIAKFLEKDQSEYGICLPPKESLFKAYEMIEPSKIRVVIIGQDPYPSYQTNGEPIDQGLAFSVARTNPKIPHSLKTVFDEVKRSMGDEFVMPSHGDLTKWVEQGVFLLNMSLTVRVGEPGSHGRRWMGFIIRTLHEISRHSPKAIYMLWGAKAQSLVPYINDKATIIKAGHPSSLNKTNPFVGCNHFVQANKLLNPPINWNV
jgi:uracil-DNA glycosylase